ncbi:hypothetical protein FIBSPDRAFT_843925 [Athelia psychrophila]|uniref:DUF1740-domain-containing protein n=1 Tax=Athelia psychrophila TaxID=1759441 RepID=A0A167V053_9AGAM|nr:hypothetical protein FIBSPDRAFT_843925 [Fibularhizoctonia sp. CBS 109695]
MGEADVWMEWLEWRIRKAVKGIDGIVDDAQRVLRSLGDSEDGEMSKLRVVWRVAVMLHHAGYMERATALFQAQAELTFEVPQSLYGLPLETLLDSLEEFWESEAPRVGEVDARGWAVWVSSGSPEVNASSSTAANPSPQSVSSDPYLKWWHEETHQDRTMRVPSRSADEDADPYATILFSDNRPLLLSLQSQRAKNAFRLIWLSLLGLNVPGLSASLSLDDLGNYDDRWSLAHLTTPASFDAIFPSGEESRITSDAQSGVIIGREKQYASGFGPVKNWHLGVAGPLESVGNQTCGLWTSAEVLSVDVGFVRRVFQQLKCGPQDSDWDCLTLAFEAALSVKSALKCSRAFLSIADDSLPHWAAHARLERLRGRLVDARKIYQTVLTSSPAPSLSRTGTSQLWWDWVEMEWLDKSSDVALRSIMRAVGVEGTSGVMILRAKLALEQAFKESEHLSWKEREAWVKLRGLLELLTSSPAAALLTFDEYLLNDRAYTEGGVAHESLMVASLLIIYHHGVTLRNPTPPAILRGRLETAIDLYPSNTVIVGMFLEAEKGRGVWGGVRGLLGETTADGLGKEKDVSRRVMEVWVASWEKGRWEAEKERTRSGLIAAVDQERTRGSPIIRRTFIEFEIRMGELQRAKKMLYAAIGDCPLEKEFYLLAFGPLRSVFTSHELNAFADIMAERGIRTRIALDELLEGWKEARQVNLDVEMRAPDSEDDELEHNAKELRRLRPY